MSFCQYYLRGNCRYGNRCRHPHVTPTEAQTLRPNVPTTRPRHERPQIDPKYIYRPPYVRNPNPEHATARPMPNYKDHPIFKWVHQHYSDNQKALDIIQQIQTEAKVWLKSSLWRFTSKKFFPNGHSVEPWIDHSFEETRWLHRTMTQQSQQHSFNKYYSDYLANIERQLVGLSRLRLETIESLKPYIDEYLNSNHQPSKTVLTDIDMKDDNENSTLYSTTHSANYATDNNLSVEERDAFENDIFELGQVPVYVPSQKF